MNQEMDAQILTDHSNDGIKEYDNPLPGWWTWIFVVTIVFSVFYFIYYHFGGPVDRTVAAEYDDEKRNLLLKQFGELGDLTPDRPTLVRFLNDEKWVKFGEGTYKTHCQSCHGPDGGGSVGPNLADSQWKNIRHIEDIGRAVAEGAGGAAMPAWKNRLHPNEVVMVSAYVASLLGSTPTNPKGPDGAVKIESWDSDIQSLNQSEAVE